MLLTTLDRAVKALGRDTISRRFAAPMAGDGYGKEETPGAEVGAARARRSGTTTGVGEKVKDEIFGKASTRTIRR